jgi:predicted NUDIX family NTP pyrophosphohydrolase
MRRVSKAGRVSAGILLFRRHQGRLELLLAHPGGPYWTTRDLGHWTIPKGEAEPGEELLDVARREFAEEIGLEIEIGDDLPLGEITQKSGKIVVAWGLAGDLDPELAHSNTFTIEWPPKSGQVQVFPEIDRVAWFEASEARRRLKPAQIPFIDRLEALLRP